ncbi:GNAT family N-acetyltransferase [Paenibacillaceae sp. P-4]|uniref:GNAT family N-acetyltransferase n=1 Tax=Paenibacillaceae bacterium P-4 TaxID=3160969 RepID=UPI0032E8296F
MNNTGLRTYTQLDADQLEALRRLEDICNEHDQIILKLNWDSLRARTGDVANDYVYVVDGEIVGFLGIYQFCASEVEISGMVHPDYRRQGIFNQLVKEAQQECGRRRVEKLIFICARPSLSGKEYLESIGSKCSFSEYWMTLTGEHVQDASEPPAKIELRQAETSDVALLTQLNMDGFDMNEEDARGYVETAMLSQQDYIFIADCQQENGEWLPIGKIHVMREEGSAFLFGFSVQPEHRGRGYGRWILRSIIERMKEQQPTAKIELEVAVENERALGLYTSCGFHVRNINDYYVLELALDRAEQAASDNIVV